MQDEDADPPTDTGYTTVRDKPHPRAQRAKTLSGRTPERYTLGGVIGKGGQGEILTATDEQIGREVAIKRMLERPTERSMHRFFREASIQGRLDHPAIVPVHELGVDADGRPFFAMKKLAGTTLAQRIAQGYPRQRLLRAFADICLAIEFAHDKGVVHRDLKPQNVVLGDFGEVYVLDWGVAKELGADTDVGEAGDARWTLDGTVIGTRGYMAPEQAAGAPDVDGRADVYALGCVLFEILAGEPLYQKGTATVEGRPSVRAPGRDVPPELDAICEEATREDRTNRIQTPRELGERVERFLDGDRDLAQRQQLAREHLDAARSALAADGEASNPTAMREAGRALALDPTLAGAGELVGRMMLEPPRVRPPEMDAMIKADEMETLKRMARAGALGYLGYLCFLPLVASSREMLGHLGALMAVLAINVYLLLAPRLYQNLKTRALLIVLGNSAMVAVLARMGSPFLLAPSVAALGTMALVFSPTYSRLRSALLLAMSMSAAVLVPWLLEALGWIEPTLALTGDGLVMTPPLLEVSQPAQVTVLVLFVLSVVGAAAAMAFQNRRAERIVRDRIHLQAWRLRQLVS